MTAEPQGRDAALSVLRARLWAWALIPWLAQNHLEALLAPPADDKSFRRCTMSQGAPAPTNATRRELARLAWRLGLTREGAPDWQALATACRIKPAALDTVMAHPDQVDPRTLYRLAAGILALISRLNPRPNVLPLFLALDLLTRDDVQAAWADWRADLIRAEFGED